MCGKGAMKLLGGGLKAARTAQLGGAALKAGALGAGGYLGYKASQGAKTPPKK